MANGDRRGSFTSTESGRNPHTEPKERERRGGGSYDAGPGNEGLPGARDMDRPPSDCGAYERVGDKRTSIPRGVRTIQEQNGNGGNR